MTAQQAPHTPLWRQVLSLPQTHLGWWAVGLVGIFWVLNATSTSVDRLAVLGTEVASGGSAVYWLVASAWQLTGVVGAVVALIALLRSHERSALVWLAMVAALPAFLGAGWIFIVLGDEWMLIPLAGVVLALIALLRRHKAGEPR